MNTYNYMYEEALLNIKEHGSKKTDRTGTGTTSLFGLQMRWNLAEGFPLITTKRVYTRPMVEELLWFLRGSTDNRELTAKNVHIWDAWAGANGNLGPIYGKQWRSWPTPDKYGYANQGEGIDQIAEVVANIKSNPDSRRHVVSAWNVAELPEMALAPCHCLFQFYVSDMTLLERQQAWSKTPRHLRSTPSSHKFGGSEEQEHDEYDDRGIPRRKLSCQLYQRSADMFLGVPFNIASYALLTHMVAQQCGLAVGEFIWTGGDCHIYDNHTEQVNLQLSRKGFDYPTLKLNKAKDIFSYTLDDVAFENYQFHPAIPAPVAV